MHCMHCGSFSTYQVGSINMGQATQEDWFCQACGKTTVRLVNNSQPLQQTGAAGAAGQPVNFPLNPPVVAQAKTREEKINAEWDRIKCGMELDDKLTKQMIYYYLYNQGMRIGGLDHEIEAGLNKKFPKEKAK